MSGLILHHYAMSPFSEKVRLMLGCAGLPWQSAVTREMPPRPVLAALAGGYRKIPVAQIGADVFCDSRTIASEIAALSGKPELALENCSEAVQDYVRVTDLDVFLACVFCAGGKPMARKALQTLSVFGLVRLVVDRALMGSRAKVGKMTPKLARARVRQHLDDVEGRLQQDFLFGAQPNHADFSTYHGLWFMRDLGESTLIDGHPKTLEWMARMHRFGHGARSDIEPGQSIEVARSSKPRAIATAHRADPAVGKEVAIAPSDYGQVATRGRLAGATPATWIVERSDPVAGTLHVHFPKQGYRLTTA